MSYPPGYPQGQYAGYQGHGQPPQTHMYQANQAQYQQQHPMVVIPTQPRRDVSNSQTSPHPQQLQFYPCFNQTPHQPIAQYQQPSQQRYFAPQRQKYHPQPGFQQQFDNIQQQYSNQHFYQPSHSQPVYQPNQNYQPQQTSPQLLYQQQPRLQGHSASPQFSPQSLPYQNGSLSLPHVSQPFVNPQALVNPSPQQPYVQTPRVQPRNHQQARVFSSPDPLQSSLPPSKRVVARVKIPIQRSASISLKSEMASAPKRRRSNEGHAIPVCNLPPQTKPAVSQQHVQVPASSSPLTQLNSSQMPPTPTPVLKAEYQPMLLALADEYVNAAYSMSSHVDSDKRRDEYHRLLSMSMACLSALLQNYRQSDARREARIRLRLASLMVDETDNDEQIEEILSKCNALCNRNRLVDLGYAMRYTSVRLQFRRNPNAALTDTDNLVNEVEALDLQHWTYTFRFLRISLSLQSGGHADLTAALKHLTAVNTLAEEERNISVQIVSASIEAVIHLRIGSSEAGDLAQRAMAAARTHQLGPEMEVLPQIRGLLDCLDLTCALAQFNHTQAAHKMQQMQANLDKGTRDAGWAKDGSFFFPLCSTDNEDLGQDTNGIMKVKDGEAYLVMKWITSSQLYALGFLLSGLKVILADKVDERLDSYLDGGLKMTKAMSSVRQSLTALEIHVQQQNAFNIALRVYEIFGLCRQEDWNSSRTCIRELRNDFASAGTEVDESTQRTLLYLEAMCRQGLGELRAALQLYESPLLSPQLDTKANMLEKDLMALATLNRIFILRSFGPEDFRQEELLAAVEPYCRNHPNESFLAVCHAVQASTQESHSMIIKTKQYLQSALQASKRVSNYQLTTLLMNIMIDSFYYESIVGDQAEKAARTGRSLAKSARSKLWTVVADGMYSDIMERCGKHKEADMAREEAMNLYHDLPESLKEKLRRSSNEE